MVRDGLYYGAALATTGTLVSYLTQPWFGLPLFILAAFCLYFFRDPERQIPGGPVAVAPADGKIVAAGGIVFLAVVLHNAFGLGLGYLAGKLGRLDDKARRALAFEVGMQNSGLAATLATAHFTPLAALPSAVFSLWHNISGAVVAAWLARRPLQESTPSGS